MVYIALVCLYYIQSVQYFSLRKAVILILCSLRLVLSIVSGYNCSLSIVSWHLAIAL